MNFKSCRLDVRWPKWDIPFAATRKVIGVVLLILIGPAILNPTQGAVNVRVDAVSVADPILGRAVSALGDSFVLSVTPDGAFVLLVSLANNLVTNDSNAASLDLFLRCRTNNTTRLVSVNVIGTGSGNGNSSDGDITPDGRYVVFQSEASNLVTNDLNSASDIFVRDMTAQITRLVSVNRLGTASGNAPSSRPVITPDGRYVVFTSAASDLIDGDVNGIPDVFLRDLQTSTTTLVSVGANVGYAGTSSASDFPVITPDGRFVAFTSTASNLVANSQPTFQEIYVRDLLLSQTIWASANVAAPTNFPASYNSVLSDDGRYVAFKTSARFQFLALRRDLQTAALDVISTNAAGATPQLSDSLGPVMTSDGRYVAFSDAPDANNTNSVWLWDAQSKTAALVSVNLFGQPSTNGSSHSPSMSSDARYITFLSDSSDLVTNEVSGDNQVYVRDMTVGVTRLVSADVNGVGSGSIDTDPIMSADGRVVFFDSRDDLFVPNDLNNAFDAFARDLNSGQIELISPGDSASAGVTANGPSSIAANSISADGRLVVFESVATDLVPGDTNGVYDIFVRDLVTGTNLLVSANRFGTGGGNGNSHSPVISSNGRYVLFFSSADDLVANDTNKLEDLFVRDLVAGAITLISVNTNGTSGNQAPTAASISADGRLVAFQSAASDLAGSAIHPLNIFLRDVAAGTTTLLSSNLAGDRSSTTYTLPIISPDGRFVAFYGFPFVDPAGRTIVKDLQTGAVTPMNTNGYAYPIAFDGDSQVFASLAFTFPGPNYQLVVTDLIQNTNTTLPIGLPKFPLDQYLAMNFDGRFIAFANRAPLAQTDTNNVEDVYLYDFLNANLTLVSVNHTGTAAGNAKSYWPRISYDGRFIAFRSAATDLVPDDTNDASDVFLFDRMTGERTLLSRSLDGVSTANGFSLGLDMTPDGTRIVFNSAASDLVNGDFNETVDVFLATVERTASTTQTAVVSIAGVARDLAQTTIHWTVAPGSSYRVQCKNELNEPNWQDLPDLVTIAGSQVSFTDFTAVNRSQRFYRLVIPNN